MRHTITSTGVVGIMAMSDISNKGSDAIRQPALARPPNVHPLPSKTIKAILMVVMVLLVLFIAKPSGPTPGKLGIQFAVRLIVLLFVSASTAVTLLVVLVVVLHVNVFYVDKDLLCWVCF